MRTVVEPPVILPEPSLPPVYDPACRRCPRLAAFLDEVRAAHPDYVCRPVPPFGDAAARLVIVGLAPGMHGANATGRPFTGDHAGILLYATLHAHGYASQPGGAAPNDGLVLRGCRITNAVKCLPPGNKPTPAEIRTCNSYLEARSSRSDGSRTMPRCARCARRRRGSRTARSTRSSAGSRCSTATTAAATTRTRGG